LERGVSASSRALPPFKVVAAALRKTTERLAREVARPAEPAPDWSELEWAIARSVAAMQGISGLLANRLRWRGPSAWAAFLGRQREQLLLREALIGRLLERIDAAARDAGLGCVALKGAALRALAIYGPGERPMADIDLLVRNADTAISATLMRGLDYVPPSSVERERHATYEPRRKSRAGDLGEHVDNPVAIEIHTTVSEDLPVNEVDITARLLPARLRPGLNAYPTRAALLLHLLLHAAGNMKAHALRQIQLHDIALLAARLDDADWDMLLEAATTDDLWWAFPPLALTIRYYACAAPPALPRALRLRCPRLLRRASERQELTDVSWSNLRISAFPGIAWSRTPAEALRYVRSRALPRREALAVLRGALERQPQHRRVPWYQLSHGRRIARWLLSRPPRVQTIVSVAAALRQHEG
jgi:hypothetical protein